MTRSTRLRLNETDNPYLLMKWPTFTDPSPNEAYNFSATPGDNRPIRVLIVIGLLFMAAFLWVYFQPENQGYSWLFGLLTVSVLFKLLRLLHEWYHYWNIAPSTPPRLSRPFTVDVLTTYCPGEPQAMVVNTLRAIQQITYPHTTYLCDEANDPYLKHVCETLGVIHVTRTNKTDAKAGNINNALHQATGEICLVIDPDHVPVPDFIDHVLPHFENLTIGFVQCTQGYYNRKESIVAFGASEQTYSFYGPMMTCMSNYGTAQAIGANCTFRRSALDSIGGHANGLSEDMHTAMLLHAKGWQSVYVPLPLSYGLVPATLSAYYKQQLKWSRGTFELLVTTLPKVFSRLTFRQRVHYTTLPLYYLLGGVQLIDLLIPILSLMLMRLPLQLDLLLFGTVYIPLLLSGFLIRQYAQRWLIERHEAGFHLVGGIVASGTWWVYVLGLLYTIGRVKVPYIPTPKDDRPRNNGLLILPHLLFILATLGAISYSVYWYGRFALNNIYSQLMIGFGLLNVAILSLNVLIGQEKALGWVGQWVGHLHARRPVFFQAIRVAAWQVRYQLYYGLRLWAIPLFSGVFILSLGLMFFTFQKKTASLPHDIRNGNTQSFYVGLEWDSLSVRPTSMPTSLTPIVPYHLAWPVSARADLSQLLLSISAHQLPLVYLEPTAMFPGSEQPMQTFLTRILAGKQDSTLLAFVRVARHYGQPMLVSFIPEFDNLAKPWGMKREQNLEAYRRAWQYIVNFCQSHQAGNIAWIWCPSLPSSLVSYYPGGNYVDWLGFSVINNPALASDRRSHSFAALYQLPHTTVRSHTAYSIRQKPILLTRLSSTVGGQPARQWTAEAIELIRERYPEIRGVVFTDQKELSTHR